MTHSRLAPKSIAIALLLAGAPLLAQQVRPNIIFILADDLGYGDLGSYGQQVIQTPDLDRMAAEGIRFTQFYAGATVCAPSRSVLMTGQHMGHTHVRGNAPGPDMTAQSLRDSDVTVAEVLKSTSSDANGTFFYIIYVSYVVPHILNLSNLTHVTSIKYL